MARHKNGNTSPKSSRGPSTVERGETGNTAERLTNTPFALMRRFSEEMNNLFQDFGFGRDWLGSTSPDLPEGLWSPQVEIFERDNQLVVRADLPGLTRDDIEVELSDDAITIAGERKNEHEEKREGFYRSERSYGKFFRRVALPDGVNATNANASFREGVLEITMPATKREERKARRLEIRDTGQQQARRKAA